VRVAVQPLQEWAQIFGEVWRLQRDHFWVPDMSGVDWPAMRERYARCCHAWPHAANCPT
jgi:tricorn protease